MQSLNRPVHTVTIFAASMGFQIVQQLGTRYITHFGTLMAHKARGQFSGEFPGQLDSRYAHVLSHIIEQDKHVIKRTNGKQTLESYAQLIQNEYWANSTRAINEGFADEDVSVECSESLQGTKDQEADLGLFSVSVLFSKCP
jgi:ATP-dependent protease ClpP protease subunit